MYEGYLVVGLSFPLGRLILSLLSMWRKSLHQLAGNSIRTLVVLEALGRSNYLQHLDADDVMHLFNLVKKGERYFLSRLSDMPKLFKLASKVRDRRCLEIVGDDAHPLCSAGYSLPGNIDNGLFCSLPLYV